jgi:molybdenum cofactor guanylyltransferase
MISRVLSGIFVGGLSSRMGGEAKGLLRTAPDAPTLVERLAQQLGVACAGAPVVLVGQRPEYTRLGLPMLQDAVPAIGPLGGLLALLQEAKQRGAAQVLAVACDLPYVSAPLLVRLLTEHPQAAAVAPKAEGRWQPLCARYAVEPALLSIESLLADSEHAMFRVLETLGAAALELSLAERDELQDWDTPEDIQRV